MRFGATYRVGAWGEATGVRRPTGLQRGTQMKCKKN
jgi:hypothetical protein